MTAAQGMVQQTRRLTKAWSLGILAGAAVLALPRFFKRLRGVETPPPDPGAPFPLIDAAGGDKHAAQILSLAEALASARNADNDAEQLACLRRASEIVLHTEPAISRFVHAQEPSFLKRCKERPRRAGCQCPHCGSSMSAATRHDPGVGDWLPVWSCGRCDVQVPR